MARRRLVAANWKMNGTRDQGAALVAGTQHLTEAAVALGLEILLCPPATLLLPTAAMLAGSGVALGGQDCHWQSSGAYTGDISAAMLRDAGCSHVILGHSERRHLHHETDALVRAKAEAALGEGLTALICVGETEAERIAGDAFAVVERQTRASLPERAAPETVVLAYEPIWAIGTGRVAGTDDVTAIHAHLRQILAASVERGAEIRILYGGSVKPSNAAELFRLEDVDGALVGGASLDGNAFAAIAAAAVGR
jgi:triosephosphate isomerase